MLIQGGGCSVLGSEGRGPEGAVPPVEGIITGTANGRC